MNPVRPAWHYTYVLKCQKSDTFYTGATNNLNRRIEEHNKGRVYYTKNRLPIKLVYFEACLDQNDAYRREKYLKTTMGKRYLRNRLKGGLTG